MNVTAWKRRGSLLPGFSPSPFTCLMASHMERALRQEQETTQSLALTLMQQITAQSTPFTKVYTSRKIKYQNAAQ